MPVLDSHPAAAKSLVIGSRGSPLALWQAHHVAGKLNGFGIQTSVQIIKTTGDHLQTASLVQAGGKGLFTKEIEEALLNGAIDLAVHSLKDLPTENPPGLILAAIPEREDPRDAIVGCRFGDLPHGATVGTSSNRRGAQLRILRPDLCIEPIRGNVDTRMRKLHEGRYQAILLAAAGLKRLGLDERIAGIFSPDEICPAPGQGALGIQTRTSDAAQELCGQLNHAETADCVTSERLVLAELGGGCQLPVGVYAEIDGLEIQVSAIVVSPDGKRHLRSTKRDRRTEFRKLAGVVAADLLTRGAASILDAGTP